MTSEPGDHVSYVSGSANCGGTYNAGTDTVTFPIGTMALGATRDCPFRVLVDDEPARERRFSDDFEPNLSNWVASHGAGTQDWSLTTTAPAQPHPRGVLERPGHRLRPVPQARLAGGGHRR